MGEDHYHDLVLEYEAKGQTNIREALQILCKSPTFLITLRFADTYGSGLKYQYSTQSNLQYYVYQDGQTALVLNTTYSLQQLIASLPHELKHFAEPIGELSRISDPLEYVRRLNYSEAIADINAIRVWGEVSVQNSLPPEKMEKFTQYTKSGYEALYHHALVHASNVFQASFQQNTIATRAEDMLYVYYKSHGDEAKARMIDEEWVARGNLITKISQPFMLALKNELDYKGDWPAWEKIVRKMIRQQKLTKYSEYILSQFKDMHAAQPVLAQKYKGNDYKLAHRNMRNMLGANLVACLITDDYQGLRTRLANRLSLPDLYE